MVQGFAFAVPRSPPVTSLLSPQDPSPQCDPQSPHHSFRFTLLTLPVLYSRLHAVACYLKGPHAENAQLSGKAAQFPGKFFGSFGPRAKTSRGRPSRFLLRHAP